MAKQTRKTRRISGHSKEFLRKLKARKAAFLAAFAESGRQNKACEIAAVSADAVALWREKDPAFAEAYLKAHENLRTILLDEAVRRAVEGVPKRIYYEGELVGTEIEYSDSLMARLLMAHDKRFRTGVLGESPGMPSKVVVISYGDSDGDAS